jgi:hypothetical protein
LTEEVSSFVSDYSDFDDYEDINQHLVDAVELKARDTIKDFFENNQETVFYSRQIEVIHEDEYFHWITNRAIRDLIEEGLIKEEVRKLSHGGEIKLLWHKNYRYYKRSAKELIESVDSYSNPGFTRSVGHYGELMVLDAFARLEGVMKGRDVKHFKDKCWEKTDKNLDFIFEIDSVPYGIEVKNTLGYIDYKELTEKIRICHHLGVIPIFVVRMMPKTWIYEVIQNGGFVLPLKYQLYPLSHSELAKNISKKLGLPVDSPKALQSGTISKFKRWHDSNNKI